MSRITDTDNPSGNGKSSEPQIEKVYEPLDEERWVEVDPQTDRREIASSDEVRGELGIEEDNEDDSTSN